MGVFEDIAKDTDFSDDDSVRKASERLEEATDLEISRTILIARSGTTMSGGTRRIVALAEMARDQREEKKRERLARKTTIWSGSIGVVGTLLGAAAGAFFTSLLNTPGC